MDLTLTIQAVSNFPCILAILRYQRNSFSQKLTKLISTTSTRAYLIRFVCSLKMEPYLDQKRTDMI